MDLELATMEDIIRELRKRKVPFVLIGTEPTNCKTSTLQVGAAARDASAVLRLLRLGRSVLEEAGQRENDGNDDGEL